jgi:hypothetical protein
VFDASDGVAGFAGWASIRAAVNAVLRLRAGRRIAWRDGFLVCQVEPRVVLGQIRDDTMVLLHVDIYERKRG